VSDDERLPRPIAILFLPFPLPASRSQHGAHDGGQDARRYGVGEDLDVALLSQWADVGVLFVVAARQTGARRECGWWDVAVVDATEQVREGVAWQ